MNRKELDQILKQKGASEFEYSLYGIVQRECYCLIEGEKWKIIYNNRGRIDPLAEFQTEAEACQFIYEKIKKLYEWKE